MILKLIFRHRISRMMKGLFPCYCLRLQHLLFTAGMVLVAHGMALDVLDTGMAADHGMVLEADHGMVSVVAHGTADHGGKIELMIGAPFLQGVLLFYVIYSIIAKKLKFRIAK
jgi:hypothetical protein